VASERLRAEAACRLFFRACHRFQDLRLPLREAESPAVLALVAHASHTILHLLDHSQGYSADCVEGMFSEVRL
jgi:hypothetical protein